MKIVGNINKGIELMNEVAPVPELPKLRGCTCAMASSYFKVSPVVVSNFVKRHAKNLERLGLYKIEPSALFEVGYIYLRPGKWDYDGDPYYLYAGYEREKRVSYILPPECLLYMAHYMSYSETALEICAATQEIISFVDAPKGVSSSYIGVKCNDDSAFVTGISVSSPVWSHNGIEYLEANGVVLFNSRSVLNLLWDDAKPQGIEQLAKFLMENTRAEQIGSDVFIDLAAVTMLVIRAIDKDAAKKLIDDIAMNIMPEMYAKIAQKRKEETAPAITTATAGSPMEIKMNIA